MRILKKRIAACVLVLLLLLQGAIPAFASDPHNQTGNTDIIRTAVMSYQLKAEGENGEFHQLTPPYKIDDSSKISCFRLYYAFRIQDYLDDQGRPNRTVGQDDYYLIDLPREINLINPVDGVIEKEDEETNTTVTIANYSFVKTDGHWQVKVIFSSIVSDPDEFDIQGGMTLDFVLDLSNAEAGKYTDIQIPIDNSNFITISVQKPVPPPTVPTKLEKKVADFNQATGELVWNVTISPNTGVFEGCVFEDTIDTAKSDFVSIQHGGVLDPSEYTYDSGTGQLSYTIPAGRNGKEYTEILITVKVNPSLYNSLEQKEIANSAQLTDDSRLETPLISNTATQTIKPDWLNKKGSVHQGNQIQWNLTVNANRQAMFNAVVTDYLQADVHLDMSSLKVDNKAVAVHQATYTPAGDSEVYAVLQVNGAGNQMLVIYFERGRDHASSQERSISFLTNVERPADNADENPVYQNTAELTTEYIDGDGSQFAQVTPSDIGMVGVGVPLVSVVKNARPLSSENKSLGTIDWDIYASSNLASYGKSTVIDTIEKNQEFVSIRLGNTPLGTDPAEDVYYTMAGDKLTIVFAQPDALDIRQNLVLTTRIKTADYGYNFTNKEFKNTVDANLYDLGGNNIVASDSAVGTVKVSNTVVEKKAVKYSGNSTGAGHNPRTNFEITINKNHMPLENVSLTDDFSALKTEYRKAGGAWETVNGATWKLVQNSVRITKVSGSADNWDTDAVLKTYDEAANQMRVDFGSGTTVNDCYKIALTLELDLTQNDIFKENGTIRCSQNTAVLEGVGLKDGTVTSPKTGNSPEMPNTLLGKFGEQSADDQKAQQITWTISMNQCRMTLQSTEIVDVLQKGLTLDPTSIRLYKNVVDQYGNFKTGSAIAGCTPVTDFTYTYLPSQTAGQEGQYVLTVKLPDDNTDYILQFATDVDKSILGQKITNSAFYNGVGEVPKNESHKDVTVSSKPGGSSTRKVSVDVRKFSQDTGLPLNGAEFTLSWMNSEKPVFVRSLTVQENGTVTFFGLTKGETYALTETAAPDGYLLDDPQPFIFIADGSTVAVDFYNTPQKSGSWAPQAYKALNKLLVHPFGFVLMENSTTVMTGQSRWGIGTKQTPVDFQLADGITEDGLFHFTDNFRFQDSDPAGTVHEVLKKTFVLRETDPSLPGYSYDTAQRELNIQVLNVKGRESLKVLITDRNCVLLSNEDGVFLANKIPTFTNIYSANGELSLQAVKYLDGHAMAAGQFQFELYAGQDPSDQTKLLQTQSNEQTASQQGALSKAYVNFDKLHFTYDDVGVHTYTIVERQTNMPGYTLDSARYTIQVTVTDNDDGTLNAVISSCKKTLGGAVTDENEIAFTNLYRTADQQIKLTGTKTLTGRELAAGQFFFTLSRTDAQGALLETVANTITHDKTGALDLPVLTFRQGDIGQTFYYELRETNAAAKGYSYDTTVYRIEVTVSDNHDGTLSVLKTVTANGAQSDILFSNRYEAMGGFTIPVSKAMDGKALPAGQFRFRLTQVTGEGSPVAGGLTQTVSNTADGSVIFDRISYDESDAGKTYYYQIQELHDQKPGYTYDTSIYIVEAAVTDNGDGTLNVANQITAPAGKVAVAFHNSYRTTDVTETFSVEKNLTGRALEAGQFSFVMNQVEADGTLLRAVDSQTNGADGSVRFADITYTQADMGKTYYYTVSETDSGHPGYFYDPSVYLFEIQVIDQLDGTLRTEKTVTKNKAITTPVFENTYTTGDVGFRFRAHKTLTGRQLESGQFAFTLFALGTDAAASETTWQQVQAGVTNDADGNIQFDELTYTQASMNKSFYYILREEEGNAPGYTYDTTDYLIRLDVLDNGDGTLRVESQVLSPEGATNPEFLNIYVTADTSVRLEAKKTLSGRVLEDGQFSFKLTHIEKDGMLIKEIETVKNNVNGHILFSAIDYKQADIGQTFYYELREMNDKKPGYSYDPSAYLYQITVLDNGDGTLRLEQTVQKSGKEAQAVFENTYTADSVSVQLKGHKILDGAQFSAGQFTFSLSDAANALLLTASNDADGGFAFAPLLFTQNDIGTHSYTVQEQAGSLAGMRYDSTVYPVDILVSDNGDGTLTAQTVIQGAEDLVFYNQYVNPSAATPGTGDPFPMNVLLVLLPASLFTFGVCVWAGKKQKQKKA